MSFSKNMTLENSTYHWFWGLRFKKNDEKSLLSDLAEWQQTDVRETPVQFIERLRQEVQAYRSRFFLIRFFIYCFNYPTLQKKMLYLEHFYNPPEPTPMSYVPPSSEEKELGRAHFSPKKQPPVRPAYPEETAVEADSSSARDKVSIPIDFLKDSVSIQMVQRVLGLLRLEPRTTYTLKEVKRAWRGQAADLHPDRHADAAAATVKFQTAAGFYGYLLAHGELYLARHFKMGDLSEAEKAWQGVQHLAVEDGDTAYQRAVREMNQRYAEQEAMSKKIAEVHKSLDKTHKSLDKTHKSLDETHKKLDSVDKGIERLQASVEAFKAEDKKFYEDLTAEVMRRLDEERPKSSHQETEKVQTRAARGRPSLIPEEDSESFSEHDGLGQEEKHTEPVVEQVPVAAAALPVDSVSERDDAVVREPVGLFSYCVEKVKSTFENFKLGIFAPHYAEVLLDAKQIEPGPVAPPPSGHVPSDAVHPPSQTVLPLSSDHVPSGEAIVFPSLNSAPSFSAQARLDSKRNPSSGKTEPESSIRQRKPLQANPDEPTEDSTVGLKSSPKNKVKF